MSHAKLIERLRKLSAYGCCLEAADALERADLAKSALPKILNAMMTLGDLRNMSRHQSLVVDMPDGSRVVVSVLKAKASSAITDADVAAIRECIVQISEKRLDPQRAQRHAHLERMLKPIDDSETSEAGEANG